MPYINKTDRTQYQTALANIAIIILSTIDKRGSEIDTSDEKDFIEKLKISEKNELLDAVRYSYLEFTIKSLIEKVWGPLEKRRYVDHQDVTGFLVCAAFEYKRRYAPKKSNVIIFSNVAPT